MVEACCKGAYRDGTADKEIISRPRGRKGAQEEEVGRERESQEAGSRNFSVEHSLKD